MPGYPKEHAHVLAAQGAAEGNVPRPGGAAPRGPCAFDYAVIRVVPAVEREEFFNAGVILFCPERRFLSARVHLDRVKLKALASGLDADEVERRLAAIVETCAGDPGAGSIGRLAQRERFHWLIAPRSTMVQVSPAHSGICDEPQSALARLFQEQVLSRL